MANFQDRKRGLVSIVIATYNYGQYICETLQALKDQTYPHLEVVVMDDGSTDDTETIVTQWYKQNEGCFSNFVYCKLPRNGGQPWALNIGFYISQGEYIVIHDGDDVSHREKIEKQVRLLERNIDTAAVGTKFAMFVEDIANICAVPDWVCLDSTQIERYYKEALIHCVCFGTLMFRANMLEDVVGCLKDLDVFFIRDIIHHNYIIENIDEVLLYVRTHPEREQTFGSDRLKKIGYIEDRVSVVVPLKAGKDNIIQLLDALALQTYPYIEVILVDGCLQDSTEAIIKDWFAQYKQKFVSGPIQELVYFRPPDVIDYPWNYNTGAYLSKGEFIVFHGDKGKSAPDKIHKQVEFFKENPSYSVVGSGFDGEGPNIKYDEDIEYSYTIDYRPCVNVDTIMMKSRVINRHVGMNQDLDGFEDFEFIYRLLNNGYRVQNLREVLYYQL